jgi:glycogen synthase
MNTTYKTNIKTESKIINKNINKKKNSTMKEKFQKKHELYEDNNHFMVLITTPLFEENNAKLWVDILPGLSDMGFQVVIRGNASNEFKNIVEAFSSDHPSLCAIIDEEDYKDAYEVSDVLLTFSSDKKTKSEVLYGLSKGVIPIVVHDFPLKQLENYNPNLESGNSFMYYKNTPWAVFATLIRAYENYRFPYDWKNICKSAVKSS